MDIEQKLTDYKWNDAGGSEEHPDFAACEKISACAESIANYTLSNLSIDSYEENEVLTVTVPNSVHPFLEDVMNNMWSDESRDAVVNVIRGCFSEKVQDESYKNEVEQKINVLFSRSVPLKINQNIIENLIETDSNITWPEKRIIGLENLSTLPPYRVLWICIYNDPPMTVSTMITGLKDKDSFIESEAPSGIVVEIGITEKV